MISPSINLPPSIKPKIESVWKEFKNWLSSPISSTIRISNTLDAGIEISEAFINCIETQNYDHESLFDKEPLFHTSHGKPDYLGTCFYLIQCLQEYHNDSSNYDQFGRFKYSKSLQSRFNIVKRNLVSEYFEQLRAQTPSLKNIEPPKIKSQIFLSHDIDRINSAWKQEGFFALKKGRLDKILSILMNQLTKGSAWLNMDDMMNLHDDYGVKSTFFWLTERGAPLQSNVPANNSDFHFESKKLKIARKQIIDRGFENGLHKSIGARSIDYELAKFNEPIYANRNHYLKIKLPDHFEQIERSQLKVDCSLGFAEQIGFRNSYGLPFIPFNMKENRPYHFTEVPLNIMDGTLKDYLNASAEESKKRIIEFLETNRYNSVLSILWHNNFFSTGKYNSWFNLYKELLQYIRDRNLHCTNCSEIKAMYLS